MHSMTMTKMSSLMEFSKAFTKMADCSSVQVYVPKQKLGLSWYVNCYLQTMLFRLTQRNGPSMTSEHICGCFWGFSVFIVNKKTIVLHQLTCTDPPQADKIVHGMRLGIPFNFCNLDFFTSDDYSLKKEIQLRIRKGATMPIRSTQCQSMVHWCNPPLYCARTATSTRLAYLLYSSEIWPTYIQQEKNT